jgi:hypothetical protein
MTMTLQNAFDKLPEYAEGGLSALEREEMARLIRENSDLAAAFQMEQDLEREFRSQPWLEPSSGFTWIVLGRAGLVHLKRTPVWVTAWERTKSWISFAAGLLILVLTLVSYGRTLWAELGIILEQLGMRVDAMTGITLFALHPLVLLVLIAPLMAGGLATCVLVGRTRLTS